MCSLLRIVLGCISSSRVFTQSYVETKCMLKVGIGSTLFLVFCISNLIPTSLVCCNLSSQPWTPRDGVVGPVQYYLEGPSLINPASY